MGENSLKHNGIIERYFNFEEKYVQLSANISILCEVSMDSEDFEQVIYMTQQYLQNNSAYEREICERIWLYAPKTMLLTTITFAINHYDGAFWDKFGQAICLNNHNLWREAFYKALEKQQMYVFKGLKTHRFVYNILGHSGIPRSQVESFVKAIILPAIKHGFSAEEIQQIIRSGNKDTPIKTYQLIESVKDFIKIPDSIATNIVERSMEVWREQLKPFTEHYHGYLPLHLLEEFEKVVIHVQEDRKVSSYQNTYIRRPTLHYSPVHQNVYISLPKQTLPNHTQEVAWRVQSTNFYKEIQTLRIPYENGEVSFQVRKKKSQLPILPHTSYNVQLIIDGAVTGQYFFEVSDFTIFNAATYEQILGSNIIAKQLLIVTTSNHKRFLHSESITCQSMPLLNEWAGYLEVDVMIKKAFAYSDQGQRYIFSPARTQVVLVGAKHDLISDLPIYKGTLRFRVSNKVFSMLCTLPNWQLKLIHKFSGKHVKYKLNKSDFKQSAKGYYEMVLPNAFQQLLVSEPGGYILKMYGSLGKDTEMHFYYLDNALSFNKENNELILEVKNPYKLNPLNANATVLTDNKKKISPIPEFEKLVFELEMPMTFEKMPISYYPDKIDLKLVHKNEFFSLGCLTTKALFEFEEAKVIIDLENPTLQKAISFVSVTVFEKLNDGSYSEKQQQLRIGRKHIINLDYFAHQPNSLSKRHLFIRIPALQIDTHLFTVETEWHVKDWQIKNKSIEVSLSTNLPNVNIKVYNLLTAESVYEFNEKESKNQLLIPIHGLDNGYYLISISEASEDEFDNLFNINHMPEEIGPHVFILSNNIEESFGHWLLANENKTDDGEWLVEDLKLVFDLITNYKKVYIPLLLEDYEACTVFGLNNIERLPNLLQQYSGETLQLLLLISGIQEWDPISVEKAIEADFVLPTIESLYIPKRFSDYLTYLPAQLDHSYNNTVQNEQCLRGFSLTHEILQLIGKLFMDTTFENMCIDFSDKFGVQLSHYQKVYSDNPRVSLFNSNLTTRIHEQNFFYTIGTLAFFNSLIFYYEHAMDNEHLKMIREATPIAYELAPKLFLHDLVYWKYQLDRYEDVLKLEAERRKQYEHPSFTWKN
ncbi:hypothetical protein GI482_06995 [Bacillus sp. N3536]|nr:hypothetical protein GI482_06995 [Bacillus sp. N3536]